MFGRVLSLSLAASLVAILPSGRAAANGPNEPGLRKAIFPVADLVIPIPSEEPGALRPLPEVRPEGKAGATSNKKDARKAVKTEEDKLIQLITSTVAPKSWGQNGGTGSIQFHPAGMSLVIENTPAALEEAAELLQALRRLQDVQASIEIKIVEVESAALENAVEGLQIKRNINKSDPAAETKEGEVRVVSAGGSRWRARLTPERLDRLLKALEKQPSTSVQNSPKVTLMSGQRSHVEVVGQQTFTTALRLNEDGSAETKKQTVSSGTRFGLSAVVSADRRSVQLEVEASLARLLSNVGVAATVETPLADNVDVKRVGVEIVERPSYWQAHVQRTETLADGESLVLCGGKVMMETRTEVGPPFLSTIPYLSRLFRNVGYGREARCVLVVATPRVIVVQEAGQ